MSSATQKPLLVVISGPTASGKSEFAVEISGKIEAEIIGADSRQFFKEMKIGTARPDDELIKQVKHYFTGHLSVEIKYNAGQYANEVLAFLSHYFTHKKTALLVGGSGLYIKAVCEGFDDIPDVQEAARQKATAFFEQSGLEKLQETVKEIDPETYANIDIQNPRRLTRILEVYYQTGKPLSFYRGKQQPDRPFDILKIAVNLDREMLYEKINLRVEQMIASGLVEEVKSLEKYWDHPNLHTVGYKELIAYFRNECSLEEAKSEIKKNTRRYAKRQLTWLRKEENLHWFEPTETEAVIELIKRKQTEC